jgi:hypothetical protein
VTPETVAADSLARLREHAGKGAFLIVTRSQHIDVNTFSSLPPGSLDQVEDTVRNSGEARLVYANADARIYSMTPTGDPR